MDETVNYDINPPKWLVSLGENLRNEIDEELHQSHDHSGPFYSSSDLTNEYFDFSKLSLEDDSATDEPVKYSQSLKRMNSLTDTNVDMSYDISPLPSLMKDNDNYETNTVISDVKITTRQNLISRDSQSSDILNNRNEEIGVESYTLSSPFESSSLSSSSLLLLNNNNNIIPLKRDYSSEQESDTSLSLFDSPLPTPRDITTITTTSITTTTTTSNSSGSNQRKDQSTGFTSDNISTLKSSMINPITSPTIQQLPRNSTLKMSAHLSQQIRDHKKVINVYQRLIGKKASIPIKENPLISEEAALSVSSVKDRLFSFMSGETEKERRTRVRLVWYRDLLAQEITLFNRVKQHHSNHRRELFTEFESDELQLQKWGLYHLLPTFRVQAWVRLSRARLLEDMSLIAIKKFEQRVDKAQKVIHHFTNNRSGSDYLPLDSYNDFSSMTTEALLAKDSKLSQLGQHLTRLDRICTISSSTFRKNLPSLTAQPLAVRYNSLQDIVKRYTIALSMVFTNMDGNADDIWDKYCEWYDQRNVTISGIEKEFLEFIEDEREREGRMFKRWCHLLLSAETKSSSSSSSSSSLSPSPSQSQLQFNQTQVKGQSSVVSTSTFPQYQSFLRIRRVSNGRPESYSKLSHSMHGHSNKTGNFADTIISNETNNNSSNSNSSSNKNTGTPMKETPSSRPTSANIGKETNKSDSNSQKKVNVSPTSIRAFIRYFATEVLMNKYKLREPYDTIIILIEGAVFKRIHSVIYTYPNQTLIVRDLKWRNKCKLCTLVEPAAYGIPALYVYGPDESIESNTLPSYSLPSNPQINLQTNSKEKSSSMSWFELSHPPDISIRQRIKSLAGVRTDQPYGKLYARSSKLLGQISSCVTPRDITFHLLQSIKWLIKEASDISQKREALGADLLFPILVAALIHANIPNMHLILHFLQSYADFEARSMGEASYYTTCLQAASAFIIKAQIPTIILKQYQHSIGMSSKSNPLGLENEMFEGLHTSFGFVSGIISANINDLLSNSKTDLNSSSDSSQHLLKLPSKDSEDMNLIPTSKSDDSSSNHDNGETNDERAMKKLSEWVRDQNTMEETISILQEEGWMV